MFSVMGVHEHHSLRKLLDYLRMDPLLWSESSGDCVTIHPKRMADRRSAHNLKTLRKRVLNHEFKGLIIRNFLTTRDNDSLTICINNDRNHTYTVLIEVIDSSYLDDCKPYED